MSWEKSKKKQRQKRAGQGGAVPSLSCIEPSAAGIDVGATEIFVAIPQDIGRRRCLAPKDPCTARRLHRSFPEQKERPRQDDNTIWVGHRSSETAVRFVLPSNINLPNDDDRLLASVVGPAVLSRQTLGSRWSNPATNAGKRWTKALLSVRTARRRRFA